MGIVDIIILIWIGIGLVLGLIKGFLKQLAAILGLIVGFGAAKSLYVVVAEKITPFIDTSMNVSQILAFVMIWIVVPLLFLWAASAVTRIMEVVSLGWLNRLIGGLFGMVKYALLASLLICVFEYVDADSNLLSRTKKEQSLLYYPVRDIVGMFFPIAKEFTEQYILEKDAKGTTEQLYKGINAREL